MELSVIIPAYNAEKYLIECLDSVFKNIDMEFEVIVVNDGSKDSTEQILKDYTLKESRLNFVTTINQGVSSARNLGLTLAKGDYILFLDSDDYLMDHALRGGSDIISTHKDLYVFNHYENRGKHPKKAIPINDDIKETNDIIDYYAIKNNYLNPVWGKLMKRSIIVDHDITFIKDMKFGEDACFMLNYLKYVTSVDIYDRVILNYRIHETNSINNVSKTRLNDYFVEMNERISLAVSMNKEDSLPMLYKTYMFMLFYYCISYVNIFSLSQYKTYYLDIKESDLYKNIMNHLNKDCFSKKDKIVYFSLNKLHALLFYFGFKFLDVVKRIKHSII